MSYATFKESMKHLLRSSENVAKSDSNRIERLSNNESKLEKEELTAENSGNVTKVAKYFLKINKDEHKEIMYLFDIFINIRVMTIKHIDRLQLIEKHVSTEQQLSEEDKRALLNQIRAQKHSINNSIKDTFQNVTSMESTNMSLQQNLFSLETQIRDLKNATRLDKKIERKVKSNENDLLSITFSKDAKRYMSRYSEDLQKELEEIRQTVHNAIIILKKKKQNVESNAKHVSNLILQTGFPKEIGENLENEFKKTIEFSNANIKNEIARLREEDSILKQAA